MFFALSKILGFFTQPSNAIAVLCALGLCLLLTRWRRAGTRLLALGVGALLLFGYSPAGTWLLLSLSERFPAWQADGRDPDGIVVLGGAIDADATAARQTLEVDHSADRIFAMLDLARRYPKARIVFSGGSGALLSGSVSEAPVAGRLLQQSGISPDRVLLEDASRNTAENAAFSRRLVEPKAGERWLLVTSAFHMPRSIGAFRAVGFEVEAYPVDWRSRGRSEALVPFDRLSGGLARTDVAVHEWIGLIAYWLTGKGSALLPAPR